uniref:Putative structural protein n=1 Tax=viral metagenome TaxID=1070528 RepID=A0A6M3IDN2_9ZZZZ
MGGVFLWAWDDSISEWIKVAVDPDGKLEVSGLEFPDTYPLPAAQVTDLKAIASYPDPVISQTTPQSLMHVPHGRVAGNGAYVPFEVDADGKLQISTTPTAHKDTHDPEDGSDPLDTAIAVKVGEANAIGTSHSLARADHVHEKHHAKYTDAEAKAAAVLAGAITDAETKAPTHDAVYDVKVTADAAQTEAEVNALIATHTGIAAAHHTKTVDASELSAGELAIARLATSIKTATITFIIDGGGSAITTGIKGALEIPFACTINRVTLLADQAGSIVIDIWKQAYADYPPEDANSIVAAAPPTLAAADHSQDATLTDWTTAIAAGDCLKFNVDSVATVTWVTLSLKVTKI